MDTKWLLARDLRGWCLASDLSIGLADGVDVEVKKYELQQTEERVQQEGGSAGRGFHDGGAVIGRLERLLIYLFVVSGELGAVGFLVAAKSIFRFGELSDHKNRLEAEYIIIGTLQSFTVGLVIAITIRQLAGGL